MKRIKKSLIFVLFSVMLVTLFTLGSPKKTEAATAGVLDVNFQTYDSTGLAAAQAAQDEAYWKQDIEAYVKALASNLGDGWSYGSEVGVSAAKAFRELQQLTPAQIIAMDNHLKAESGGTSLWDDNSSFTVNVSSSKDSSKTLQEVWGNIGSVITETIAWNVTTVAIHNWNGFTAWGRSFATPTTKTQFAAGDTFYLAVFVTSVTPIDSVVVSVQLKSNYSSDNYWVNKGGTVSGQVSNGKSGSTPISSNSLDGDVMKVGYNGASTEEALSDYLLAYITLGTGTISSGSFDFSLSYTNDSTWSTKDYTYDCQGGENPSNFATNTATVTIGGSQSTTTNIANPTFKTDSITTSVTTTGTSPYYTSTTNLGASDTNLYLSLSPQDNATIDEVRYSTTSATAAQTGTVVSASSTNNYTVPLSSVGAGDTIYVAIKVKSQDGNSTEWKYVTLSKPQSTVKTLDGFTLTSNSATNSTNMGDTYSGSASTTTYNCKVAGNATTLTFNIQFSGDHAVFGGTTYNSSPINVTTTSVGSSYTLDVYDQAGNSQSYTFNIATASTNGDPTVNVTPYVSGTAGSVLSTNTYTAGVGQITGFAYNTSTVDISVTAPSGGSVVSVNGTSGSSVTGLTFPSSAVTIITLDESGVQHTYSVTLTKLPDTTKTLDGFTITSDSANGNTANLGDTYANTTTYSYNIKVASDANNVKFDLQFTGASATLDGNAYTSGTVSVAYKSIVQFIVKAQDNTTQTYTFNITKASGDGKPSVTFTPTPSSSAITAGTSDITESGYTGTATVGGFPYNTTSVSVSVTAPTSGSVVSINGSTGSALSGVSFTTSSITVTVVTKDESGATHTYTYTLNKSAASTTTNISNVKVGTNTASSGTSPVDWTYTQLPNTTSSVNVSFSLDDNATLTTNSVYLYNTAAAALADLSSPGTNSSATLAGNLTNGYTITGLNAGDTKYVAVFITAQDGTTKGVKIIEVGVKLSSTSAITAIAASYGTNTLKVTQSGNTYTVDYPSSATTVTLTVTFTGASVSDGSTSQTTSPATYTVSTASNVTFTPSAPDGTTGTAVTVTFNQLSAASQPAVTIQLDGSSTTQTVASTAWDSNKEASISVPYGTVYVKAMVTSVPTGATLVRINTQTIGLNSYSSQIYLTNNGIYATSTTVIFDVNSAAGITDTYTLTINRDAASSTVVPASPTGAVSGPTVQTPPPPGYDNVLLFVMPTQPDSSATYQIQGIAGQVHGGTPVSPGNVYTTLANALALTGATDTVAINSGKATITLGATGTSVFYAVEFTAENGINKTLVIYEVPRASSNNSNLDNIVFNATGGSVSNVTICDTSGNPTTFTSATTNYKIIVPSDATGLDLTATFGTGKTGSVNDGSNTVAITSGTSQSVNHNATDIKVTITAQSGGSATTTYTFTIVKKSSDASIQSVKVDGLDSSGSSVQASYYNASYVSSTNEWVVTVPYSVKSFKVSVTPTNNNATVEVASVSVANGAWTATPATIANATNPADATSASQPIVVTAENGTTTTQTTVLVKRSAADTTNTINIVDVEVNDGTGWNSISGNLSSLVGNMYTWTAVNSQVYASTSVRVSFTVDSQKCTVKVNGSSVGISTSTIQGAPKAFATVTTSQTLDYDIVITSESGNSVTYRIKVDRDGANTDTSYSLLITYTDENGATQSVTTAPDSTNPLAYAVSSLTWKLTATDSLAKITLTKVSSNSGGLIKNGTGVNISGTSDSLTLNAPKNTSGNFIVYTIEAVITAQSGATDTIYVNIYVKNPTSANSLSKWDLLPTTTGTVKTPDASSSGFQKDYTLSASETFTIDLAVLNDPNNLTKIYTSLTPITGTSANDYATNGSPYSASRIYNPNDIVYVYVVAEDGSVNCYTFKTTSSTPLQANAEIDNIVIDEIANTPACGIGNLGNFVWNSTLNNLGSYTVPYGVKSLTFTVTPKANSNSAVPHANSTIKLLSSPYTVNLNAGLNTIKVQLQAQNGDPGQVYTIEVTREPAQTYDLLTDLTVNGTPVPKEASGLYNNTIDVAVPRNNSVAVINLLSVLDGTNDKAKYEVRDGNSITGTLLYSGNGQNIGNLNINGLSAGVVKTLTILVYSEKVYVDGGLPNQYTLNLYPADQTYDINDIKIVDNNGNNVLDDNGNAFAFNSGSFTSPFVVPYSVADATLKVVPKSPQYVTIKINGNTYTTNELQKALTVGTGLASNEFTVVVDSEFKTLLNATNPGSTAADTQTVTYTIQIDRNNGSSVNTLNALTVVHNGSNMALDSAFVPDSNTQINYTISNANLANNSVTITVKPTDPKSTLGGSWINNNDGTYTKTFTVNNTFTGSGSDIIEIDVYSEVDTVNSLKYTITISKASVSLDTNHQVTMITASVPDGAGSTKVILGPAGTTQDQTFVDTTTSYSFSLDAAASSVDLVITYYHLATLYIDGAPQTPTVPGVWNGTISVTATKTITILCVAQSGQMSDSSTYTITLSKAATSDDTTLDSWYLTDPSAANPTNPIKDLLPQALLNGKVYLDSSYAGKTLNAIATVTAPRKIAANGGLTYTDVIILSSGSNVISVTVNAETPGKSKTYIVDIIVNANLDLASIVIEDDQGQSAFNTYDSTNQVTVPFTTPPVDYVNNHSGSNKTEIWVENTVTMVRYCATLADANAKFDNANGNQFSTVLSSYVNLGNGSLTIPALTLTIVVVDQEGNNRSYTIDIYRLPGETGKDILSYTEEGQSSPSSTFQSSGSTYEYRVDTSITSFNPEAGWTLSQGASYKIYDSTGGTNRVLNIGKNVFTVEIYSQNEPTINPHVYTITVWRANNDYQVNDIEFLKSLTGGVIEQDPAYPAYAFNPTTLSYDIYVPYGVNSTYLRVTLNDSTNGIYHLNGNPAVNGLHVISVGPNTFTIKSISQYGQLNPLDTTTKTSETYQITVHQATPSSDATLKDLQVYVYDAGEAKYFDFITGTYYNGTVPGSLPSNPVAPSQSIIVSSIDGLLSAGANVTQCNIAAFTNDPKAKILSGTGIQTFLLDGVSGQTNWVFSIVVQAEDGVTQLTYTVTLSKAVANPSKDNSIKSISVIAKGQEYIANFNEATQKYQISIPYGPDSYTLSAQTGIGSAAKIYIGTTSNPTDQKNSITNTLSLTDCGSVVTYYVQAEASDTTVGRGQEYEVEITFGDADHNNALKDIKIDGTLVTGFDPDTLTYNVNVPNTTDTVNVSAVCASIKGKIVSGIGNISLKAGDTTQHSITVQAEDGTTRTYILNIYRDSEDPFFADLDIPGYGLQDPVTEKDVPFDPTAPGFDPTTNDPIVKEYKITVPYTQATGSITIKVPDGNYATTISQTGQSFYSGITRTFDNLTFDVGPNEEAANTEFLINGTSPSGKTVVYKVTVTRLGKASADTNLTVNKVEAYDKIDVQGSKVLGQETEQFKNDWKIGVVDYTYTVSNKVVSLDLFITPAQSGATVNVYGANKLEAGKVNDIAVVITAADGMTTKAYVLHVERLPMEYEVDLNGNMNYTLTENTDQTSGNSLIKAYDLNIGSKKLSEITQKPEEFFKNYIKYDDAENAISVEILSDITSDDVTQVLLRVTDGTEEEFIAINLVTETGFFGELTSGVGGWLMIGGVAVCIALLVAILVAVNKDKYGKVADKRKKA